jgi:hypothetical protein
VKLEILEGIDMKPSDINGENYQRTALFDAYICSMHFLLIFCLMIFLMFYCIGLSDPYVKGRLGPCKFQTQIQRKTLSPKWFEEFKIPITSWEASNELVMEVCDKDHLYDDSLGYVLFSDLIFVK